MAKTRTARDRLPARNGLAASYVSGYLPPTHRPERTDDRHRRNPRLGRGVDPQRPGQFECWLDPTNDQM